MKVALGLALLCALSALVVFPVRAIEGSGWAFFYGVVAVMCIIKITEWAMK